MKTWFTIQVHGADRIGAAIARSCALAGALRDRIERDARLELLAPVALNIVCFRYRCSGTDAVDIDAVNAEIVIALQQAGRCAPSSTRIDGRFAIRVAIVNHRTTQSDIDRLVDATLEQGARLLASMTTAEPISATTIAAESSA